MFFPQFTFVALSEEAEPTTKASLWIVAGYEPTSSSIVIKPPAVRLTSFVRVLPRGVKKSLLSGMVTGTTPFSNDFCNQQKRMWIQVKKEQIFILAVILLLVKSCYKQFISVDNCG